MVVLSVYLEDTSQSWKGLCRSNPNNVEETGRIDAASKRVFLAACDSLPTLDATYIP
ncbi:hypothetical protein SLEP1_g9061 [Rubroshorea leprosula]|uniref:Uncharacterized protein n=1 Tax=Rubroshorea leprosula TaxID=152421 RepID=A0AAV5I3Q9_9ROSI|nr:hypothetical protein SLEP1_g9061 [Rubroshorea leprosula]